MGVSFPGRRAGCEQVVGVTVLPPREWAYFESRDSDFAAARFSSVACGGVEGDVLVNILAALNSPWTVSSRVMWLNL
jgi:hypothetical protein